jgi:hypothetical protein
MRRVLRDSLVKENADALCKLFQQFRVDEIEPAPGFYSRVLDEIAVRRQSVWLPLIYTRFTLRLAIICVFLTSSALLLVMRSQRVIARDYHSVMVQLTSSRPEEQRNAVLAMFLADSPLSSPTR